MDCPGVTFRLDLVDVARVRRGLRRQRGLIRDTLTHARAARERALDRGDARVVAHFESLLIRSEQALARLGRPGQTPDD